MIVAATRGRGLCLWAPGTQPGSLDRWRPHERTALTWTILWQRVSLVYHGIKAATDVSDIAAWSGGGLWAGVLLSKIDSNKSLFQKG